MRLLAQVQTRPPRLERRSVLSTVESEAGVPHGRSFGSLKVEALTEGVKAAAFSPPDIVRDDLDEGRMGMDLMGLDVDFQPFPHSRPSVRPLDRSPPRTLPSPPAKGARCVREEIILAKNREQSRSSTRTTARWAHMHPKSSIYRPSGIYARCCGSVDPRTSSIVSAGEECSRWQDARRFGDEVRRCSARGDDQP